MQVDYPSDLYACREEAPRRFGAASVDDAALRDFHDQGFLAVDGFLSPTEVETAKDALSGLLKGDHPDYKGFEYEAALAETAANLPPEQRMDFIRKFWRFIDYSPPLKALSEHREILAVVERLMGGPPKLFQDMALIKPPRIGREKPWHQDLAYFDLPLDVCVIGIWIALDAATRENGCMCVMPGSHLQGPRIHFKRRDWQICDSDIAMGSAAAIPLAPGGCLFFHGMLQHGTPANRADDRRRALQFHYKPAQAAWSDPEKRLSIWGSDGKDVSC